MGNWISAAILLVVFMWSQVTPGVGESHLVTTCDARAAQVPATPPDFLFATEREWKRYALEADVDRP
jgi:hypothetical protein